ncbi:uncharacterized protein V6R79_014361 [Siganus canaliculatus]
MSVNLSKNGPALMAAYRDVVDSKSDTDWALFTYEGNSNDIRLAEKGGGGLEEMVEELSSGKVMYAFCRVQDPNSGLPKFVLINWTGEGVKDSRKGACANHVGSMANFLKGAHVTINARGEDDVEPDDIMKKVAKTSGANFNFHKQTQEYREKPAGPVGSVYRKVNAMEEIQQTDKDDFWLQTQRDEENRRREEVRRAEQEKQERERERREEEERLDKERRSREREQQEKVGSVYRKVNAMEEIQQTDKDDFWLQAQRDEEVRRREEVRRAEQEKQERERERREEEERLDQERRSREREQQQKVGSVYRKVNAMEEIQQTDKDDFWLQAQRDEEVRRREEVRRAEQEKQELERERREEEERLDKERQRRANDRARQIQEERICQQKREEEEREREQQQRRNKEETETKRTGINFTASVQKANEAKSLVSQRSFNPRDVFKQREQSFEASDRPSAAGSRPGKLQSPFFSQKSLDRETLDQPHPAPASPQTSPINLHRVLPVLPAAPVSRVEDVSPAAPVSRVEDVSPAAPVSPAPGTAVSPVQASDSVYAEEEEWSDEFDEEAPGEAPPEEPSVQEDLYDAPMSAEMEENLYEDVYHEASATDNHTVASSGDNVCARAVYDYQAADDTEITFDPDDIITGIEMVDEGWWRGFGPDGRYGMFPANYVELL